MKFKRTILVSIEISADDGSYIEKLDLANDIVERLNRVVLSICEYVPAITVIGSTYYSGDLDDYYQEPSPLLLDFKEEQ